LELGGKDAAYVRADADVNYSAIEIADGAMFNSGQSCCAVERVYVHEAVYDSFVEKIVAELKGYKLGDPNGMKLLIMLIGDLGTTTGPVVSVAAAARIRKQISDAVESGANAEIPTGTYAMDKEGSAFVGPQVLTNVTHDMSMIALFCTNTRCYDGRNIRSRGRNSKSVFRRPSHRFNE
jgi:acyl-CoA reductase-like NAD-dependent aldehyde dehydrogenase